MSGLSQLLYNSQGRPDLGFRMSIIDGLMSLLAFYVGLRCNGIGGLLWAYLIWSGIWFFPALIVSGRIIGVGLQTQIANVGGVVALAWGMAVLVFLASRSPFMLEMPHLVQLFALFCFGVFLYIGGAFSLRLPVLKEVSIEAMAMLQPYFLRLRGSRS